LKIINVGPFPPYPCCERHRPPSRKSLDAFDAAARLDSLQDSAGAWQKVFRDNARALFDI